MIFKDPDIEKALDKIHYPLMILKTLPIYIYTHTHTFIYIKYKLHILYIKQINPKCCQG